MQGIQATIRAGEKPLATGSGLPAGIRMESEPDGVRYILPQRDLGEMANKGGAALLIFGVVITIFMILWMSGPIRHSFHEVGLSRLFSLCFGLAGLPGLAIGAGLVLLGVAVMLSLGHSEVLVSRGMLWVIECIGPFKFKFKRDLKLVDRLVVSGSIRSRSNGGEWKEIGNGSISAIKVEGPSGKLMLMAAGYPRDFLKAFAENLTLSISGLSRMHGSFSGEGQKIIAVVEESLSETPEKDVPVMKPAGCNIEVREIVDGVAVMVPSMGAWKGSKGLFGFSFLWNGFMVVFTSVMFFARSAQKPPWQVYLFVAGFWGVGIAMLLGGLNMGRRQTMIAVVNGTLGVKSAGLFGIKETRLKLDEIGAVHMGPSGMETNDVPVMELQIMGKDGKKKLGVLSERRNDELLWIAWLIRSRTGLGR